MYLRAKSVQSPLLQCVLQRIHFISEDNVIFFKGVPNDDPIQDPETAGQQQRGGEREEQHELRRNRARFSSA